MRPLFLRRGLWPGRRRRAQVLLHNASGHLLLRVSVGAIGGVEELDAVLDAIEILQRRFTELS